MGKGSKHRLRDDGANLSRASADTVGGGTVSGGEAFARNDEGGRVGTKVEEELGQDV